MERFNPPSLSIITRILNSGSTYFTRFPHIFFTSSSRLVSGLFGDIFFESLSGTAASIFNCGERGLSVLHQSVSFGSPRIHPMPTSNTHAENENLTSDPLLTRMYFFQIAKCICPNYKLYLSKLYNVLFVQFELWVFQLAASKKGEQQPLDT